MAENQLFPGSNIKTKVDNPQPDLPIQKAPPLAQGIQPPIPTPPSPPQPIPPPPIPQHGGKRSLFIKIFIVIILLSLIGFLVFRFAVPFLSRSGGGSENAELTYWGLWESESVMQSIIQDFERENPTIKVKYEQRDGERYRQTLITRIENGDGPDVYRFHNSWTPTLLSYLAPLPESVIAAEEFEKTYYPVIVSDLTRGGAIYGIPLGFDTLAMFVNTEMFENAGVDVPATWEDFTRVSSILTVTTEEGSIITHGAAIGAFDNVTHAPDLIASLLAQNRVEFYEVSNSQANFSEALRFYTDFVTGQDNISKVWDASAQQSRQAFAAENVGMYFGYSWDIFDIKAQNPDLNFTIHPMPYLIQPLTMASYWAEGVSSKSTNKDAAYKFLKFLSTKETHQKLFTEQSKIREFGVPPARIDLADTVKDNPFIYPFVEQGSTARSSYFASDTYDDSINSQMNGYLGNAVRGILGNTSVDSATETLLQGINQVLDQYGLNQ